MTDSPQLRTVQVSASHHKKNNSAVRSYYLFRSGQVDCGMSCSSLFAGCSSGGKSRSINNMNTQIDAKESQTAHREVSLGTGRRRCDRTLLTVRKREGPSVTGS